MTDDILSTPTTLTITTQPSAQEALDALSGALRQASSDAERISVSSVWSLVNSLLSHISKEEIDVSGTPNAQDDPVATEEELEERFQEAITDLTLALGPGEDGQASDPQVGFANLWNLVYALIAHYELVLPDYLLRQPVDNKAAAERGMSRDQKLALLLKELAPLYRQGSEAGRDDSGFGELVEILEELARKAISVPAYWKTDLEQLGTILAGQTVNGFWNSFFNGSAIDQMKGAQHELLSVRDGTRLGWVLMVIQGWQEKQSLTTARKLTHIAQRAATIAVESAASATAQVQVQRKEANDATLLATAALEKVTTAEQELASKLSLLQITKLALDKTQHDLLNMTQTALSEQAEKATLRELVQDLRVELAEVRTAYEQSIADERTEPDIDLPEKETSAERAKREVNEMEAFFVSEQVGWDPALFEVAQAFKKAFSPSLRKRQVGFFLQDPHALENEQTNDAGAPYLRWTIDCIPKVLQSYYRDLFLKERPFEKVFHGLVQEAGKFLREVKQSANETTEVTEEAKQLKKSLEQLVKRLLKLYQKVQNGEIALIHEKHTWSVGAATHITAEVTGNTAAGVSLETRFSEAPIYCKMYHLLVRDIQNDLGLFCADEEAIRLLRTQLEHTDSILNDQEISALPQPQRHWATLPTARRTGIVKQIT